MPFNLKSHMANSVCVMALAGAGLFTANTAMAAANPDDPNIEIVVVTATRGHAADVAPTKSSLDTIEPQSIITRTWIENSVADTSDFAGIVSIAPSVSGGFDLNGPGLSEAKFTVRGFSDGQYNIRYDGIPFGDTNDPTHHSTAFFPASTVGGVEIDRGPGLAGDLGQESLGGSVNLYSRTLSDTFYLQQKATYGTWDTRNFVTTLQSGVIDELHGARITLNLQELQSNGYLSLEKTKTYNQFLKFDLPLSSHWRLTMMMTHNSAQNHLPDNGGITLAQAAKYGKNFTLSNDPTAPTYYGYNTVYKHTDFEYLRLNGDIAPGLTLENTGYTYSYINHTESATQTSQSANDILANTYAGWGTWPNAAHPKGSVGAIKAATDVNGYDKLNAYRVWGDILRVNKDFEVLGVKGQVRGGFWYEFSETDRHRYYFDWTLGGSNQFPSYQYTTPACASLVPACPFTAATNFFERSSWHMYQPFFDLELHPLQDLTVVAGAKYVDFNRGINAPVGSSTRVVTQYSAHYIHDLPYAQANYKINDVWSVYAQYGTGFLTPPLSSFYVTGTPADTLKPQSSTNYSIGTVYNVDAFSFDADVYYARAANAFQTTTVGGNPFYYNSGTVDYRGVEAEATYAFGKTDWDQVLDGFAIFANGSVNEAESPDAVTLNYLGVPTGANADYHKQLKNVPKWTAAFGMLYNKHGVSFTIDDKFVGEQWAQSGEDARYKIPAYSVTNLVVGYEYGPFKLQVGAYNLFDNKNVSSITVNSAALGPTDPNSYDQFNWLPERSFQVTLRATLD